MADADVVIVYSPDDGGYYAEDRDTFAKSREIYFTAESAQNAVGTGQVDWDEYRASSDTLAEGRAMAHRQCIACGGTGKQRDELIDAVDAVEAHIDAQERAGDVCARCGGPMAAGDIELVCDDCRAK